MPKQKSKKSILRRFKITKTGKVMRRGASGRHLNAKKSRSRRRRQGLLRELTGPMARKIKKASGR